MNTEMLIQCLYKGVCLQTMGNTNDLHCPSATLILPSNTAKTMPMTFKYCKDNASDYHNDQANGLPTLYLRDIVIDLFTRH